MKLTIKKDKRAKGKYFHKAPNIKCAHTKKTALKDISSYCEENLSIYTRNYVHIEALVLSACSCKMEILTINATIY